MGQVTVTLNGRSYRLRCGEDEEQRLFALAAYVRGKLDGLVEEFGQAGDDRLLLMAALLIADELFDAHEQSGSLEVPAGPSRPGKDGRTPRRTGDGAPKNGPGT